MRVSKTIAIKQVFLAIILCKIQMAASGNVSVHFFAHNKGIDCVYYLLSILNDTRPVQTCRTDAIEL